MKAAVLAFTLIPLCLFAQFPEETSKMELSELKEIVSSFCKQEKQFISDYTVNAQLKEKFFFARAGIEFKGKATLAIECPQFLRFDLKSDIGQFQYINNGVEAWISYSSPNLDGKYVQYYPNIKNKNLGHWMDFFRSLQGIQTISGKSINDFDVELKKKKQEDTKTLAMSVRVLKYKSKIDLNINILKDYLIKDLSWEEKFGKLQLESIPNTQKNTPLDRKYFHYFPEKDDKITTYQ